MGTVYRKTVTRTLPEGAEQFAKAGEQFARWKPAKGKTRTSKVTTGTDGRGIWPNPRLTESAGATEKSLVAPDVGERGQSVSFAVYESGIPDGTTRGDWSGSNSLKPNKEASFAVFANEAVKRGGLESVAGCFVDGHWTFGIRHHSALLTEGSEGCVVTNP